MKSYPLGDFETQVSAIIKRGKATMAVMEKMGAPQTRINDEETAINRELLNLRINTTARFGELLSQIIRDNS